MFLDTCKCGQIDNCPSKDRIIEIAEISTIQMANARERFLELICSPKYTFAWTGQIVSYNEKYGMIWLRFQIEQVFKGSKIIITNYKHIFTNFICFFFSLF